MKKTIWALLILLLAFTISAVGIYMTYQNKRNEVGRFNKQFEIYQEKEIYGAELATIINKVINENEKNNVSKSETGKYIENNETSVKLEVHIKDNDTTYLAENFYKLGTAQFVENFNTEKFKCTNIEYHNKSKRVKSLFFEQIWF